MREKSASNWNTWEDFLTIRSRSPISSLSREVTITLLMNSPAKFWGCKALAGNGLDDVI